MIGGKDIEGERKLGALNAAISVWCEKCILIWKYFKLLIKNDWPCMIYFLQNVILNNVSTVFSKTTHTDFHLWTLNIYIDTFSHMMTEY